MSEQEVLKLDIFTFSRLINQNKLNYVKWVRSLKSRLSCFSCLVNLYNASKTSETTKGINKFLVVLTRLYKY